MPDDHRRGWRILLTDVSLITLLMLGVAALDSYHARKAELADLKSSCEDRLISLSEEVSKRTRIVQLVQAGGALDDQKANSDISSTAGWNRVLHGCLGTDLFDTADSLWVTFPEVRKRSDEALGQPPDTALVHLTDANHWALFALEQVREAELADFPPLEVDAPSIAYEVGDRFQA